MRGSQAMLQATATLFALVMLGGCVSAPGRAPVNQPAPATAPGATAGGATGGPITIDQRQRHAVFGSADFHDVDYGARVVVSTDGTLVAALVHEVPDFRDDPVETVVVWRVVDGRRIGAIPSANQHDESDEPYIDARDAAEAAALLASHAWVEVTSTPAVTRLADGEGADVALRDNRVLHYKEDVFSLSDGGAVTPPSFDAPGAAHASLGGGGCGSIFTLEVLASGDDWLLVAPDYVDLGGDECVGRLYASLAQVIKLSHVAPAVR